MKSLSAVAAALGASVVLWACGGGGGGEVLSTSVASADTKLAASPATTASVTNVPFTFSSGVAQFGTTAPTTLTFTSNAAEPAFAISSGGNTATGSTKFGSCIFTITQSTFPASSPLALGKVIPVHPCEIKLDTAGQAANGQAQQTLVSLVLASAPSTGAALTVSVSPTGEITVNGQGVGSITIKPATGT